MKNTWGNKLADVCGKLYNNGKPSNLYGLYLDYSCIGLLRSLCVCSDLASQDVVRSYDLAANNMMIRLVEPVLYSYLKAVNVCGGNINLKPFRKSVPSKSRMAQIYSPYLRFDVLYMTPYNYYRHVKEDDELSSERAYYYLAIQRHNEGITNAVDLEEAKEYIRNYIKESWTYRSAVYRATSKRRLRNRYDYTLHIDLQNSQVETWMQMGRRIQRDMTKFAPIEIGQSRISYQTMRQIIFAMCSPVYKLWNDLRTGVFLYEDRPRLARTNKKGQ